MAIRSSGRNGDPKALNRWFRARIIFQGATVAAIVAGSYAIQAKKQEEAEHLTELEKDPRMKERLEFEARLRAAEEMHAYEQSLEKARAEAEADNRSVWEKLGLGRGSHQSREAAMKVAPPTTSSSPWEPAPVASVAPATANNVTTASAATTSVPGGIWGWPGWSSGSQAERKEPEKKN